MPDVIGWIVGTALVAIFSALAVGGYRLLRRAAAANVADWGGPWLNLLDGLNRLFCRRYHRLRGGHLRLPRHGPALVVSNHVSGLDPLLMLASSPRPLRFLIAREEYERFGLRWLFRAVGCIPVSRQTNPRAALSAARQALQRGEVVALFPHGRIHLDHEPPTPLKRGVVYLAASAGAPIYPVRVEGIHGQGRVVGAVFRRSSARLHRYAPIEVSGREPLEVLNELAGRLAGGRG